MKLPNKRYICSIRKNVNGKFVPNVVVIAAKNDLAAKMLLSLTYGVPIVMIKPNKLGDYTEEGISSIRLAETNMFETENPEYDNFSSDT